MYTNVSAETSKADTTPSRFRCWKLCRNRTVIYSSFISCTARQNTLRRYYEAKESCRSTLARDIVNAVGLCGDGIGQTSKHLSKQSMSKRLRSSTLLASLYVCFAMHLGQNANKTCRWFIISKPTHGLETSFARSGSNTRARLRRTSMRPKLLDWITEFVKCKLGHVHVTVVTVSLLQSPNNVGGTANWRYFTVNFQQDQVCRNLCPLSLPKS